MKIEADAHELGFDTNRLARISSHFQGYVDQGLLPGWQLVVSRGGQVVYHDTYGRRDIENGLPIESDSVYRIYSMTKPIATVAAMMLYEEGRFKLKDEVASFIPSFADQRVYRSGASTNPTTEGITSPMQIWHLMTHTSGLTYGFLNSHPVDAMYRAAGFEWGNPPGADLEACTDIWAGLPLLFQPGSEWNYSNATDVLGRLVEVISGQSLDVFMRERIFEPLGMTDTAFFADAARQERLGALYIPDPDPAKGKKAMRMDMMGNAALSEPAMLSGGGGLVSTAADYHRFTQMLLNRGELDGVRLLGTRTVEYMATNHLPGGAELAQFGRPLFSETDFEGMGFGLGGSVVIDPAATKVLSSKGEFAWGGAASTAFWVDPVEEITALFLTQLLPSSTHPIRPEFKQLVYQALVD
ncbi:MAG: beta-lactamase family protein [Actinomycetia bacterium]|nr:beta-lactamase family protein [Actinomycetes bacterium]